MLSLEAMGIVSLAVVLNLIVIVYKFQHQRWSDLITDLLALTFVSIMMTGSTTGATIGFISSAMFSIFLLFYRPDYTKTLSSIFDEDQTPLNHKTTY